MNILLFSTILFPLFLALMGLIPKMNRIFNCLAPWAALPALLFAVAVKKGDTHLYLPSVLFGTHLGLDGIGRVFLFLTTFIWLFSGLSSGLSSGPTSGLSTLKSDLASYSMKRYRFFFLLTLTGNLGVTVSQDAGSFYTFFALMTLSGFGLISHNLSLSARTAGRVYITLALIGEMLILSGLILASYGAKSLDLQLMSAAISASPSRNMIAGLIFLGFGVKVGLVPFHIWLPLSYNAAPIPAAAVLSGAMTKAGILGWIRFLPLGTVSSETWELIVIGFGTLMAFYGALLGLAQVQTKPALAYSSLSQMGYLTIALGTAVEPESHPIRSLTACVAYAIHHGIAKACLFLGVAVMAATQRTPLARALVLTLLLCVSLSLVGIPFTGGAFVKGLLKESGSQEGLWHRVSGILMLAGSAATAVLMARIMVLYDRSPEDAAGSQAPAPLPQGPLVVSWALLVLFSLFSPLLIPILLSNLWQGRPSLSPEYASSGSALLIATLTIVLLISLPIWSRTSDRPAIPTGDLLIPIQAVIQRIHSANANLFRSMHVRITPLLHRISARTISVLTRSFTEFETVRTHGYAGVGMLLVVWAMFWLLFISDTVGGESLR